MGMRTKTANSLAQEDALPVSLRRGQLLYAAMRVALLDIHVYYLVCFDRYFVNLWLEERWMIWAKH